MGYVIDFKVLTIQFSGNHEKLQGGSPRQKKHTEISIYRFMIYLLKAMT